MAKIDTHLASRHEPEQGIVRYVHHIMGGILVAFTLAAIVLGEMMELYDTLWWWDDMLHGASGVIFGLVGLYGIFAVNKRSDMKISPMFVAVFVTCFAMAVGVVWEIFEFTVDVLFKTAMQQWDLGVNARVLGQDYQGMGLRDTMSDLVVATIGSLIAGVISYFIYGRHRQALVRAMRRIFPFIYIPESKQ